MKDELRPRSRAKHLKDHPLPTVIHHPEDDETMLARWLRIGMEKGTRFWLLLIGSVAAITLLLVLLYVFTSGDSASEEAWLDALTAKTPDDLLKVAETHPQSTAANWARLQAAGQLYKEGMDKLATQRDLALPILNRAYEQFERVFKDTKDPIQKRLAAFRMARTLEARGELDEAIEQYQDVAAHWPSTDEAEQAERLVKTLQTPESKTFYRELATFKPSRATLRPEILRKLGLPPDHPSLNGPIVPARGLRGFPGMPSHSDLPTDSAPVNGVPLNTIPGPAPTSEPSESALPKDVFAPASKATSPPSGELPRDVFAPGSKGETPKS